MTLKRLLPRILLGVAALVLIAALATIYPAVQASRLLPVEAMRE